MKLGIAGGSYIFTRGFVLPGNGNYGRADVGVSLQKWDYGAREWAAFRHELLEMPLRYYEPFPEDYDVWFIQRGGFYRKKYGLHGLHLGFTTEQLSSPDYMRMIKRLLKKNGVVCSHYGAQVFPYYSEERFRSELGPTLVSELKASEMLGTRIFNVAGPNTTWNRFRPPPLSSETRIERYANTMKIIAETASSYSVVVTLENHADLRVKEVLEIIRRSGHSEIMINFDTGNCAMAIEDPLEAAEKVAPYVMESHIKDIMVDAPIYYGGRYLCTPIGRGDIDFRAILELFERVSPDPRNLSLDIEPHTIEGSEDAIVDESLRYLRNEFSEFLD